MVNKKVNFLPPFNISTNEIGTKYMICFAHGICFTVLNMICCKNPEIHAAGILLPNSNTRIVLTTSHNTLVLYVSVLLYLNVYLNDSARKENSKLI